MRTLTTNWNDAANASATSFLASNGVVVTIPANKPVDVRSMKDSVAEGGYTQAPYVIDDLTGDSAGDAETVAALATVDVVATLLDANSDPVEGARLVAASSDVTKFTVSPAQDLTDASGQVTFTLTGVAAGEATLTVKLAGSESVAITPVTVTVTA